MGHGQGGLTEVGGSTVRSRFLFGIAFIIACLVGVYFCAEAGGGFFLPALVFALASANTVAHLLGAEGFLGEIAKAAGKVLSCRERLDK